MTVALIIIWAFTWQIGESPTAGPIVTKTSPWYESKKTCDIAKDQFRKETGYRTSECEPVALRREG